MAAEVGPVAIVSVFWVIVGAIVPWFIPKGSQRGIIQAMIIITAVTCYVFWLCTYMSQMYPLVGPSVQNNTALLMEFYWSRDSAMNATA